MLRRFFWVCGLFVACSSKGEDTPPVTDAAEECPFKGAPEADMAETPPHTPRWAFRPWISKDISDRADTYAFVKGFEDRDIPVGVVVLDSPWETNYHSFVPNPTRYGDFAGMLKDLHAKDIKLVLWMTQMQNMKSWDFEQGGDKYEGEAPDYHTGEVCRFYTDDGEIYGWWKGQGGAVDFFNPSARAWWHSLQKPLLDMGVDGWKLDFGDSYMRVDTVKTAAGVKSHQEYSEAYYRDFLLYGRKVRGNDFLTMVRPWDESYDFKGRFFARREHAPVAWVGDNKRNWAGLIDALDETFRSAVAGYPMIGSDIGGYLDLDDKTLEKIPADTLVFARWTATMAMLPFFQLHGRANSAPWTVGDHVDETVAMYRYWAKLHDALVPFFYSLTEEAWSKGGSPIAPVGAQLTWPTDYRFVMGNTFLVAPLLDATGKRAVALPDGKWYDWFSPAGDALSGSVDVDLSADRQKLPVYVKEGAIVPMDVVDDANALGTKASKGARTVLYWPSSSASSFPLHEEDDKVTTIESGASGLKFSRSTRPVLVRQREATAATKVVLVDASSKETELLQVTSRVELDAAKTGWFRDASSKSLWIKVEASPAAFTISVR